MRAWLPLMIVALPLVSAKADERHGDLQVCRPGRMTVASAGRDIAIPAGTQFMDSGPMHSRLGGADASLPVSLETTIPATLKQGQRCLKVAAVAHVAKASLVIAPGNHRLYQFSGSTTGGDKADLEDLTARPSSRFR